MFIKCLAFCFILSSTQGLGVQEHEINDIESFYLECTYNAKCVEEDIIITAQKGHLVLVTINSVNISGENGDFLLIKSGTHIHDGLTGRIFTYHINQEREYISLTNQVFVHFHVNSTITENPIAFILSAEQYGKRITSSSPSPEEPLPTPCYDNEYLIANMTVNNQCCEEASSTFQRIVANMGNKYVDIINLDLSSNISTDDVHIRRIIKCPIHWQNRDTCYQFTFAILVNVSEASDYYGICQLNATHLRNMWEDAPNHFNAEDSHGILVYEFPRSIPAIGMGVIWAIIAILAVLSFLVGYFYSQYLFKKRVSMKNEEEVPPFTDKRRTSQDSLPPHPFQSVPPLFQSDMQFYEPDSHSHRYQSAGEDDRHEDGLLNADNFKLFARKKIT